MLSFALCDDNKSILDKLCKMLEALFIKHNFDAEIAFSSTSPEDTLQYVKENVVNVLLLDIDLKSSMSGLDLASEIRKTNKHSYIIFTSAHLEYILIAYQYKTFDFIPKPITLERLEETFLRIIDDINSDYTGTKFIHIDNKNTIISQDCINFIKKDGMKLLFYTDNKVYERYGSLSKIEDNLPSNFVRCHKSYIANVDKISNINSNDNSIFFDNISDEVCYIGPKYKKKIMEVLNDDTNFTKYLE